MSKVRINDLARELEVKSKQVLDILAELGMGAGKTHSSSLEEDEANKVRAHFTHGARTNAHAGIASSRNAAPTITPKIDLSHISKPGDVLKAILAKKKEEEEEARHPHVAAKPAPPAVTVKAPAKPVPAAEKPAVAAPAASAAPAAPRKIVPQPRSAPPIVRPPVTPAIATRPPSGPVVAKAPAGAHAGTRPVVVVAPPPGAVVVKPPAAPAKDEQPRAAEKPAAKVPVAAPPAAPVAPAPAAPSIPAPQVATKVEAPVAAAPGRTAIIALAVVIAGIAAVVPLGIGRGRREHRGRNDGRGGRKSENDLTHDLSLLEQGPGVERVRPSHCFINPKQRSGHPSARLDRGAPGN